MSLGKTLTTIVLIGATIGATIGAAVLPTGCSKNTGSILSYQGKVGDAEVVLYKAKNRSESDRMEVTEDGVTWVYVDKNKDKIVDYAERKQEGMAPVAIYNDDAGHTKGGLLDLRDFLSEATENYKTILEAIEQKVKSE